MKDPALNVAAYIRVSTAEQGSSGLGLEVQHRSILAAIDRTCSPDRVCFFKDIQSGGKTNNRNDLLLMMAQLPDVDALFVHRLDRLARNALDLLSLLERLRVAGVAFHSIKEAIDTSTPVGRLFTTVLAGTAEFERDLHRARTREALALKKLKGEHVGRPPLGFLAKPLRVDPATIHTAIEIFRLRRRKLSLRAIAARVSLPLSTIRSVLSNPIYANRRLL